MSRRRESQEPHVIYVVILAWMHPRLACLRDPWRVIKDEWRMVWKSKHVALLVEEKGRPLSRAEDGDVVPTEEPIVDIAGGLAWLQFKDEDNAWETSQLLDGHYWAAENTRLEAWLQRGIDGQFEQLHGPIDEATGCERPAPVPRSPAPARIAVQTHRRQVSNRAMHLPEPQHGAQQHLTGTAQISPAPRIVPNRPRQTLGFSDPRVAGPAYHPGHSHQHSSISYPAVPVPHPLELGSVSPDVYTTPRMPRMSISSRSSNSSQGPPTPGCSNFAGTPPRSAKGSISSTSTSSSTLRGTFQLSQLVDEVELLHIAPNPSQTQTFKVVVRNLKPRTTKKEFNDLLEQKIQTYLHYSEMNLVESRGQLYGEITFKDSEVADRVVRKLNGFRFKDRKLQVQRVGS